MILTINAKSFVNQFYDESKQNDWIINKEQTLIDMVENYLEEHNFFDYNIKIDNVDIWVYVGKESWDSPQDFILQVKGKIICEIKI